MNAIIDQDAKEILARIDLSPLKNKRVLLTGANGLFGRYIASTISVANRDQGLNCKLSCLSLHGATAEMHDLLRDKRIVFLRKDLSSSFHIRGAFDYVFHAACYGQPAKFIGNPFSTLALNVEATKTLLEYCRKWKARFIFFSSAEVYGDIPKAFNPVSESYNGNCDTRGLRAIYGESKRMGETICSVFEREFGVSSIILRISHTYGPGISIHDARVLGNFLRKALVQRKIELLDQGKSVKTYGYIGDVTAMIFFAALQGAHPVYNVGGKDTMTIRSLATHVGKICNVPVRIPKKDKKSKYIGQDPGFLRPNLSRILKEMKSFTFTPFPVGLERTIQWNKEVVMAP